MIRLAGEATVNGKKARKEKMIKVAVRFWASELPAGAGSRTAWDHGTITLTKNYSKSIQTAQMRFRGLNDLMPKMMKLLKLHNIRLLKSRQR